MKPRLAAAAIAVGLAFSMPGYADDSTVYVDQYGSGNDATVNQTNSPGGFANVYQSGSDHFAGVGQTNSPSSSTTVYQYSGNQNTAYSYQYGEFDSQIFIQQVGSYNYASVSQYYGSGNTAWALQGGNSVCLDANCNETADLGESTGNAAYISQYNSSDSSAITAQGGASNTASIYQADGTSNTALVNQSAAESYNYGWISQVGGSNNFARVNQSGSSNYGGIQQGGYWCTTEACTDYGPSNGSTAYLTQDGMNQSARIGQFGQAYASAYQAGQWNELEILQVGYANTAYSTQYGNGSSYDERNIGKIDQQGSGLYASLYQSGMMNNANIIQR